MFTTILMHYITNAASIKLPLYNQGCHDCTMQ